MYNEKVMQVLASFSATMENLDLSEQEKMDRIRGLGIFAVAALLNELDNSSSALSAGYLEDCVGSIVGDYTGERVSSSMASWRTENEQAYWDIIDIMQQ